uniref:Uncharacterized protein n=1 Tax=Romanomermis culicivorax TaxID=13658 RepID=A0A915HIN0_ROMCU
MRRLEMTNYLAVQSVILIIKTVICVVLGTLIFTPFTRWFNTNLKNGGDLIRFPYDVQYFRHRFCFLPTASDNGSDTTALTRLLLDISPKFYPIGRSLIARGRCLEATARKAPWFKLYVGSQEAGGDENKLSTVKNAQFRIPFKFWQTTDVCLCDFRFTTFLLFIMLIVNIVLNIPAIFILTNDCQTWNISYVFYI